MLFYCQGYGKNVSMPNYFESIEIGLSAIVINYKVSKKMKIGARINQYSVARSFQIRENILICKVFWYLPQNLSEYDSNADLLRLFLKSPSGFRFWTYPSLGSVGVIFFYESNVSNDRMGSLWSSHIHGTCFCCCWKNQWICHGRRETRLHII